MSGYLVKSASGGVTLLDLPIERLEEVLHLALALPDRYASQQSRLMSLSLTCRVFNRILKYHDIDKVSLVAPSTAEERERGAYAKLMRDAGARDRVKRLHIKPRGSLAGEDNARLKRSESESLLDLLPSLAHLEELDVDGPISPRLRQAFLLD